MKTLATIILAALSLNLAACATDDDQQYRSGAPGLRPGYKPELGSMLGQNKLPDDGTDITENGDVDDSSSEPRDPRLDTIDGVLDGQAGAWAEDILENGRSFTLVHVDGQLVVVDDEGKIVRR